MVKVESICDAYDWHIEGECDFLTKNSVCDLHTLLALDDVFGLFFVFLMMVWHVWDANSSQSGNCCD